MSELTDDQLDGLFRKSAEEFETPFDSAAWQDIKARLDANDRVAPTSGVALMKNILRWGLPLVLLLLLVGLVIYQFVIPAGSVSMSSAESKTGTAKTATDWDGRSLVSDRPNTGEVAQVESLSASKQAGTNKGPETDPALVTPDQRRLESRTNAVSSRSIKTRGGPDNIKAEKLSEKKESGHSESVPFSLGKETKVARSPLDRLPHIATNVQKTTSRSPLKRNKLTGRASNQKRRKSSSAYQFITTQSSPNRPKYRLVFDKERNTNTPVEIPSGGLTDSENELPASVKESSAVVLPDIAELAMRPAKWPKSLPFINRPVEVHPDTTARKIASQPATMRGLSIRFAVSPDLSGIGLKNFARPGTNIGLFLEYRLSSHWSVQSGFIQSTKVYKAATSDYEVPADWWKSPLKLPESVDGRCSIFDIPINIRYDVVTKPRPDGALPTHWFISGGVTSYIMNKENYHYTYPPHTYNQPVDYSVSTGGYGFSHLNLSVGYERSLSRRLSWQIEPFMKIPLKGVGLFKVNLLSTGTFFSLRYKL